MTVKEGPCIIIAQNAFGSNQIANNPIFRMLVLLKYKISIHLPRLKFDSSIAPQGGEWHRQLLYLPTVKYITNYLHMYVCTEYGYKYIS